MVVLAVPYAAAASVVQQYGNQLESLGLLHIAAQFTLNTGFGSAVKIIA